MVYSWKIDAPLVRLDLDYKDNGDDVLKEKFTVLLPKLVSNLQSSYCVVKYEKMKLFENEEELKDEETKWDIKDCCLYYDLRNCSDLEELSKLIT